MPFGGLKAFENGGRPERTLPRRPWGRAWRLVFLTSGASRFFFKLATFVAKRCAALRHQSCDGPALAFDVSTELAFEASNDAKEASTVGVLELSFDVASAVGALELSWDVSTTSKVAFATGDDVREGALAGVGEPATSDSNTVGVLVTADFASVVGDPGTAG